MRPGIVFLSCALALSAESRSKDLLHSKVVGDLLQKFDDSRQQAAAAPRTWDEKRIALPRVGSSLAYVPHSPTPHVVLLVSGASGWDSKMVDVARGIAGQAIVVGISYPALTRTARREIGCWYVASDFEIMSHAAQKALSLPQYHAPV